MECFCTWCNKFTLIFWNAIKKNWFDAFVVCSLFQYDFDIAVYRFRNLSCQYVDQCVVFWRKHSRYFGPKWGLIPFSQTFQQNASCLKLFRDMPLFWNSIFRKSSSKCKTRFLDNRVIVKLNLEKKKKKF